ncbi:MAG: tetratricopeptide repeat protein [bacterium]
MKQRPNSIRILTFSALASITFFAFNHNVIAQEATQSNQFYSAESFADNVSNLEGALKSNPRSYPARVDLISAYTNEGNRLANNPADMSKAASYYRKAIFLMQYDSYSLPPEVVLGNLAELKSNLDNVLKSQKINISPKSRLELAKKLRGGGKYEEAIVEYNQAASDPSLKAESLELAADTLRLMDKDTKAIEFYKESLMSNSNSSMLHLKFARALNKVGNAEDAMREYNIALNTANNANKTEINESLEQLWSAKLAQNPQDPEALMNMGVILQKNKKYDEAMNMYNQAEQLDPTNETLRLNKGTLFQQQGDLQTALQAYETILDVNPKNTLALYYRATALRDMGRTDEALAAFYNVLNIDNNYNAAKVDLLNTIKNVKEPEQALAYISDYAKNFPNDPIAQYNYAYQLHILKKTDEAIDFYKRAISLNPKFTDAYLNIASAYKDKGLNKEAMDTIVQYLKIDPNNSKAKNILAQFKDESTTATYQTAIDKFNNKDYQGAVSEYQNIINGGDTSVEAYLGLGSSYQSLGKYDDAINAYNKALAKDAKKPEILYSLGSVYYDKGSYEKAVDNLQKSLVLDPTNKDTISLLGDAKKAASDTAVTSALKDYHANRYDIALQKFNKAIVYDTNNAYPYYYKGIIYDSQKKYKEAVDNFQKAIARDKELHIAYYLMGLSYESMGNKTESIKALQKFLELSKGKDDEYTKYAKYKIQELKGKK